ncbi:oxysterol-binding protein-related protein 9 isoform X1 [Drosophila persimilis]|uniref:oxysterol-binding protein-related protein 9 isoform X1 n=1 Tax=Drosophila persimilis TaxID=7234 RepID=UPI000F084C72|nr:oxysterol-binding protein-related protein 9 isoform X1 [Drosophila persimilis]
MASTPSSAPSSGAGFGAGAGAGAGASTLEGTLSKWTNVMKGWQYRFFVLDENAGLLSYYTSKEKMMKGVRRGCVRLKDALIGIDDQEDNTFTITVDHKTFHFQARHSEEREQWVRRLEDTIRRHANRSRLWDSQSAFYIAGGYTKESSYGGKRPNHLELLARRVSEADAYLQLMIEQTNLLEKRIAELSDPDEQAKCKALQDNASAMLDHIKHSIVSLQIAKNMAHPINGIYNGPQAAASTTSSASGGVIIGGGIGMSKDMLAGKGEPGDDEDDSITENATTAPLGLVVPETSYSSSEGEEDFYDAHDDPYTSLGSSPIGCATRGFAEPTSPTHDGEATGPPTETVTRTLPEIEESAADGDAVASRATKSAKNSMSSRSDSYDNGIDYDALYEEEEENDLSMEAHGSMITHLLSQVKIGMDLTKVVLPTFILERRSLLEMYADYFAHPDLFIKISELDDPRDRIVQVCRWYLSAYHAGRKSAVAKKPYNPILGEVFQCHWDLPDEVQDTNEVHDGPVPWCRRDQLTFLAEQVSHHPPISAFYAEHYNKKITFAAHVWTKSKFLGLSIGVHNIGEGVVTLVDRSEEYIVTFPNGYGRSILTVPWIELGGSVEIKCPQTGYHANVEFLTKPFYGGKRNKVSAEVYAPNDKKPFVSIAGEWSGLMEAKWHDKNKTEVFVDVNRIPIFKKQVRPIVEQDEYESRRVWKEVTAGLKFNDIERATNAKFVVEQQQRDQVKMRKEYDLAWEHKHFKPVGENWIYAKSLSQRIYLQEKEARR